MIYDYFVSCLDIDDPSLIGTKGFNLHQLSKIGFNTPSTFYITTKAYEDFITENKFRKVIQTTLNNDKISFNDKSQQLIGLILGGKIPHKLEDELASKKLLNKKWAVRSSSNLEDLPNTSFAGLYDSYLNVKGMDNIIDSIKKCWASLWNERAIVYREKNNLNHTHAKMAVIIQEMVNAEYAGVIFTEDPTSGNKGEILLEYCEGLGERLVSGVVTPYSCKINKSSQMIQHGKVPERRNFGDDKIREVSTVALKVEKYFGCPQDIEWAFDGKKIYVLQTRPLANKIKAGSKDGVWTRANVGEVLPNVVTPLTWDVFRATLLNRPALALNPSNDSTEGNAGIKLFHGRIYIRLNDFLDSFCYLPTVTPPIMTHVLGVHLPSESYVRPKGGLVRLRQAAFMLDALGFLPHLAWSVRRLSPPPPAEPNRLEELITWNARCFQLHLKCTAYAIGAFGLLAYFIDRWLPSEAEKFLPLILMGNENLQTAAQGISLWQLAAHARKNPDLRGILDNDLDWSVTAQRMVHVGGGPEFLTMFQAFLDANGARAAGEFELAVPRWREDPTFVLGVMRRFLDADHTESFPVDPTIRRHQREKAISHIKASLGTFQQWVFTRLLNSYSEFTTLRENVKYRLIEGYALLRHIFLEMGNDLEVRGRLQAASDVFFITPSEILALIARDELARQTTELILERKAQHSRWQSQDAPDLIMRDGQENIKPQTGELTGIGCSPGTTEGVARVLLDPSEADALKTGEILVAPHTDPGWTPLFLSCKAVVTEIGGFLSHGATVAREYGIPAVVNVTGATTKICTGDLIRVNGTNGLVTICDKAHMQT